MNETVITTIYVVASVGAAVAVIFFFQQRLVERLSRMTEYFFESRRMHSRESDSESRAMLKQILDVLESARSFQSHYEENRSRRDYEFEKIIDRFREMSYDLRNSLEPMRQELSANLQLSQKTFSELSAVSRTKEAPSPDWLFSVYQQVSSEFSHSIKTPIASIESAITNFREWLADPVNHSQLPRKEDSDILVSFLENASISLDYVKSILRRGAGFFPGDAERFSLQSVVRKALRMTSEAVKSRPKVSVALENIPEIKFHWLNLLIPIIQVLENAFEAVPDSGEVKVDGAINATTGEIAISVSNDGQPIPENIQTRIFDVGFSTRGAQRGSGLAIARRCLLSVNAKIELTRSDTQSTVFTISFNPQEVYAQ